MKKILLLLLIPIASHSQSFKEKELKTEIKEVTIFLSGAQIFESGKVSIPQGKSILRVKDISPYLDEKSIQVKAEGDFTILSVNHKFNFLKELTKDVTIDSLIKVNDAIEQSVTRSKARLDVLNEKKILLNENRKLGGQDVSASLAQLKQAVGFYDEEFMKLKTEEISLNNSIQDNLKTQNKIKNQLKELNDQKPMPGSEIEIRINAESATPGKFNITYLVSNAGWYPKYDIRVKNIKEPLTLTYKAEVFQNTGIDWKNVKLRFSNGDPNQSGTAPELNTWNLNYARYTTIDKSGSAYLTAIGVKTVRGKVLDSYGTPLPGVNVLVKGSTIGTVTDATGGYNLTLPNNASQLIFSFIGYSTQDVAITKPELNIKLDESIQQLSEVVVTGYGVQGRTPGVQIRGANSIYGSRRAGEYIPPVATTFIENQTTVEIEVDIPYSIASNGEKLLVDLKQHDIKAAYEYYAVPKLDKDAFLIARVTGWDQYNLLEGEANLYFEDAYVGRTVLDAKSFNDTLSISLGRDKNIVVGRTKNEEHAKRRSLGGNQIDTREFKILVRNKKPQPIKITLFDQVPVSVVSDITVSALELSNGIAEEKTGKVTWEMELPAQQQKELILRYEVKYPKREKVILE